MRPLRGAVHRALQALHLEADVERATALGAWPDAVTSVLGPAAREIRAVKVDASTLVVLVPDAGWAGEIRLREREIVTALRAGAPRCGVTRLRCAPANERGR